MSENQTPPKIPVPPRPNIQTTAQNAVKDEAGKKQKSKREPLSDQSKTILFGLLGAFSLLGGLALLIVMLVI